MSQLSRRQIAEYAASKLAGGDAAVVDQVAAYLVANGRTREVELVAADIEKALQRGGIVPAEVSSARSLTDDEVQNIEKLLQERYNARPALRLSTDESLLGGVVIKTATEEFDGSLRKRINRLKAMKV